jgi:hypothetical protein
MPETTQFGGAEEETGIDGALQANTILLARYRITGMLVEVVRVQSTKHETSTSLMLSGMLL